MTESVEPVGLIGGMFFEYYLFDPQTNFTEEDLAVLLKSYDVTFDSEESIPESVRRHFEDRVFVPKDDITVNEFVDILDAQNITIHNAELLTQFPQIMQENFEGNVFRPYDDFGLQEVKLFLSKVISWRWDTKQFETLTPRLKRQFMVQSRNEAPYRWGSRRSG